MSAQIAAILLPIVLVAAFVGLAIYGRRASTRRDESEHARRVRRARFIGAMSWYLIAPGAVFLVVGLIDLVGSPRPVWDVPLVGVVVLLCGLAILIKSLRDRRRLRED